MTCCGSVTVTNSKCTVVVELTATKIVDIITAGPSGPAGVGVPTGGLTGQVLAKNSNSNYDTIWSSGGSVTSVSTGTGLTGGPITTTGTISLANTTVTSGSYTYGSFTVDAQGRLTAASSGTAPVTSVSATGPITSSGGTTPTISTSMTTNRLLGRSSAGVGVVEEIIIGSGLSLSAGTLSATGGGGGSSVGDNLYLNINCI